MSRRSRRSVLAERRRCPRPRSGPSPRSARSGAGSARPVVDLPQPDSPTRPSVSPRRDLEAHAVDRVHQRDLPAQKTPRLTGKCLIRPSTWQDADVAHGATSTGAVQQATLWPGATSRSGGGSSSAAPVGERAARREAAALGWSLRARHRARDGREPRRGRRRGAGSSRAGPACRGAAGRRTARATGASRRSGRRTSPPRVGDLGDDAEIVGDEHDRHAELGAAARAAGRGSAPGW